MNYKHFQLIIMTLLIFATFGTAYGMNYNLIDHAETNGYSPNFLKLAEVKQNCQEALVDGWLLGYCSKELGTL